jgi:hypothetical protein
VCTTFNIVDKAFSENLTLENRHENTEKITVGEAKRSAKSLRQESAWHVH